MQEEEAVRAVRRMRSCPFPITWDSGHGGSSFRRLPHILGA
ncbi:MAG: hypothetical protein QW087_01380 [Methanomassiliicoccales archaeon]